MSPFLWLTVKSQSRKSCRCFRDHYFTYFCIWEVVTVTWHFCFFKIVAVLLSFSLINYWLIWAAIFLIFTEKCKNYFKVIVIDMETVLLFCLSRIYFDKWLQCVLCSPPPCSISSVHFLSLFCITQSHHFSQFLNSHFPLLPLSSLLSLFPSASLSILIF